jgi:histidine triad (HIT) family protein
MKNCIFCDFEKHKEHLIYEDEFIYVIHDKFPVVKGHLLVIPKKHYENIMEMPDEELCDLIKIVKEMEILLMKKMEVEGFTIKQNWQPFVKNNHLVIHHVHFHIVPRKFNDKLNIKLERMKLNDAEIKIVEKIKK